MSEFYPNGKRVLVKQIEAKVQTPGGLFIPEQAKEKPQEGEVIARGNGLTPEEGPSIGDRVLFGKYAGTTIKIAGVEHLLLNYDEILGVIRD